MNSKSRKQKLMEALEAKPRETLTRLSRELRIPVVTIFDLLKEIESEYTLTAKWKPKIQHDFKCGICGKTTHLHQDDRDMDRAVTNPMSDEWEAKHGGVNVGIRLDCGHYMLDDKDDDCPTFVAGLQ